ncbi:MAG: tetratricopeptide (TPR) repeat protein [Gammaproteobacteria bacterium]|jgi:tetratricopeptide (TPR) repeat protein
MITPWKICAQADPIAKAKALLGVGIIGMIGISCADSNTQEGTTADLDPTPIETPTPKDPSLVEQDEAKLGNAFRQLGAGDLNGCRATAMEVLENQPEPETRARAEFMVALSFHKAKQYADARPHFDQASRGPDFQGKQALPYFQGWCYFWLGELDAAEASFQLHLTHSAEGDSHFGLGVIALDRGDAVAAKVELQKALELFEAKVASGDLGAKRDLAKTHARLADVYLDSDDFTQAKSHLLLAVQLDSDRSAVWYKLYQVHLELGEATPAANALAEYKRCLESPESAGGMAMGGGL